MRMIARPRLVQGIKTRLAESAVTILIGARQTGKTTLARMVAEQHGQVRFFDLEVAADRMALATTPEKVLSDATGLVILDEIQRMPSLFEVLRPLADRPGTRARFLLLGSASPELVRGTSETLAGRALFLKIPGFTLDEVGLQRQDDLWLRGGFPRSMLAADEAASLRWRESFIDSFLERETSRSSAYVSRPRRCAASGTCCPTFMARSGMQRSWPGRWGRTKRRQDTISTSSPAPT